MAVAYKTLEGRKSKFIAIQPDFSELCEQPHAGSEERVASATKTLKRKGTCFPIALPLLPPFCRGRGEAGARRRLSCAQPRGSRHQRSPTFRWGSLAWILQLRRSLKGGFKLLLLCFCTAISATC